MNDQDNAAITHDDNSTVTGGHWSTVTGGDNSIVTGGDYSIVTGGYRSFATGGDNSSLSIAWYDGNTLRISIAYVGEDGIEPNVAYMLDENGKFVRA